MEQPTEQEALDIREKYVRAWNDTMVHIWKERITLLDVRDTDMLLHSPLSLPIQTDGRFYEMTLTQKFLEYGFWQDYGVGAETPRGNSGDIGRKKVRQKRPWFSRSYFASVMNLKDFLAESIGQEFVGVLADTFERTNKIY